MIFWFVLNRLNDVLNDVAEVALLGQASGPSQEPTFIGVVTPFKEMRVTDTSLLEANRDEWFSRHLIDGKIIYSDHR